ncbi:MAG: hypothetical protein GY930_14470, partial [bacterium]|nr:hypothetical protein [bacterium]
MLNIRNTLLSGLFLALSSSTFADGTETLGVPQGIASASGSDYLLVGAGLADTDTATLQAAIPTGATVTQVLAYWDGLAKVPNLPGMTDTIVLNGIEVTGDRIGGPSTFVGPYTSFAYRADVTALGLIGPGTNSVTGTGLDFDYINNGFGLLIVIDDGDATQTVELRDGSDFAYGEFPGDFESTALQTFEFDAAQVARSAELGLFVTGVETGRPSVLEITVGGVVTRHADVFGSNAGGQWDALELALDIPAGVTTASARILSEDSGQGPQAGGQIASLNWVSVALSVETAQNPVQYGCSPHFWMCNWHRADCWYRADNHTESLVITKRFNRLMGINCHQSGLRRGHSLWNALTGHGSCGQSWQMRALNRHAAAAMLNADSNINYPYTTEQVRTMYQDAVGAIPGPETVGSVLTALFQANNLGCPW